MDVLDTTERTTSTRVPSLTGRSQSVSIGSDAILTRPPLPRRGSREPADSTKEFKRADQKLNLSSSQTALADQSQTGARPASVTSFMDQTQSAAANAISSFQNKSMNFFRRLDSRQESFSSLLGSSTSGSQEKLSSAGADPVVEPFVSVEPMGIINQPTTKTTTAITTGPSGPPPKPPPPANRPLSAASSNSILASGSSLTEDRQSLMNQNNNSSTTQQQNIPSEQQQQNTEANPDDTMKNLRKTFAGIFGDI